MKFTEETSYEGLLASSQIMVGTRPGLGLAVGGKRRKEGVWLAAGGKRRKEIDVKIIRKTLEKLIYREICKSVQINPKNPKKK